MASTLYIGMLSSNELYDLVDVITEQPFKAFRSAFVIEVVGTMLPQRDLSMLCLGQYADENDPKRLTDLAFLKYMATCRFLGKPSVSFDEFFDAYDPSRSDGVTELVAPEPEKNVSVLWDF